MQLEMFLFLGKPWSTDIHPSHIISHGTTDEVEDFTTSTGNFPEIFKGFQDFVNRH